MRLKYPYLRVKDLFPAWTDSCLRLRLMMDDELVLLTVSSVSQLEDASVWNALGSRILGLGRSKKDNSTPANFTKANIERILLVDLQKLKAQDIHASPADFPPLTFLLIDFSELQKIATNRLTTEQLHLIFSSTYFSERLTSCHYVHVLQMNQINACIPLIKNKKLFINLTEDQMSKLDFSRIDQAIFDVIFELHHPRTGRLLQASKLERVYEISKYFGTNHGYWAALSDEQILKLDYSRINQSAFDAMFALHHPRTVRLFATMTDAQLLSAKHLIGSELKKKLNPHQKQLVEK